MTVKYCLQALGLGNYKISINEWLALPGVTRRIIVTLILSCSTKQATYVTKQPNIFGMSVHVYEH